MTKIIALLSAVLVAACVGKLYLDFKCWSLLRHARVPMASSEIASWQTRSVVTRCRRAEAAIRTRANASIFNLGVWVGKFPEKWTIVQELVADEPKTLLQDARHGLFLRRPLYLRIPRREMPRGLPPGAPGQSEDCSVII